MESDDPDENQHDEIYPADQRKKIVEYWYNDGNKRSFSSVKHRYRKLNNENTLRTWKKRMDDGIGIFFISILSPKLMDFQPQH